ncbi:MAG: sugar phosphate isomerase/epimerase family protein [Thermodesulfobacteriota bacterium]
MFELIARARGLEEARLCLKAGFHRMEITLPCPGGAAEEKAWAALAADHTLRYLAHGPQEGNPGDLKHLEKEYLPELERAIKSAAGLGIPVLTVHMWLESRFLKPEIIAAKTRLLGRAADRGREAGVRVSLENLSEGRLDLSQALEKMPGLGLTLDLGHAQLLTDSNTSFEIIEHLFPRIVHLHLHDNFGGKSPKHDLHLPPGKGRVPFLDIFRMLKARGYQGTACLELNPGEMVTARDYIIRLWNEA